MLKPVRDNVYIAPIYDATRTKSGLYIPEQAQTRCDQGIVKYVGPDVKDDISIGDYVFFANYSGNIVRISGEGDLIIVQSSKVIANLNYMAKDTTIKGLYFKSSDGEYIEINYESLFDLVAESIQHEDWYKDIRHSLKMRPRQVHDK